jgi:tetratricopeptide (TPR) repeat protein
MESDITQTVTFYRVWGWFETNKKQVITGIVAAAVIGLIIGLVVWRHDEREMAASEALSKVYFAQLSNPTLPVPAEQYLKVAAAYPGANAGARAVLLAAGGLFSQGKYEEARAQFQRVVGEYSGSPFQGQALLGIAASLDALGKTNEALKAYSDLVTAHPNDTVAPQAKYALAGLYERQNKPEQAIPLYQQVERSSVNGSILGTESGMRIENLLMKNPALAAPAPRAAQAAPSQKK